MKEKDETGFGGGLNSFMGIKQIHGIMICNTQCLAIY